jgi:hypothetical protein
MPEESSRRIALCGRGLNLPVSMERDVEILHLLELVGERAHLLLELMLPLGMHLLRLF